MCSSKQPKPLPAPAPAPPPVAEAPVAPVVDQTAASERNTLTANKAGRSSLRIDKTSTADSGQAGLGIPTA